MSLQTSSKRKYTEDYTYPTNEDRLKRSNTQNENVYPDLDPTVSEDYEEEGEEEEIKQFSSDQRLALTDEPICVVCGKYGEYINDDTNQDVCSLQCKSVNTDLNQHRLVKKAKKLIPDPIHLRDYVAENIHAKLTYYQEPPSIASQSTQLVEQMLKAHDISLKGAHIPKPFTTFDQLLHVLGPTLLKNIEELGWSMATGIQRQGVTIGLAGRDLYAISPTHSGKTGAFLIPLLVHCISLSIQDNYKRRAGPYALIMAPTREICQQIESVCQKLAKGLRNIRTGLLIGGEPLPSQLHRLKTGVQVVIGTPGRLLDIATHHPKLIRLWNIRMMVIDEADAMFSLGFGTQVKQLLGKFPKTTIRQTSLFSATAANSDENQIDVLYKRLKKAIEIRVEQKEEQRSETDNKMILPEASDQVRQTILWVENKSKAKKLFSIIRDPKYFVVPILIFVSSRLGSEFLSRAIKKRNSHLRVVSMHGDKTQEERRLIIEEVNQTETKWDIVVSTDVLARGVDLPMVRLVINYDMATTLDDYVHRIGRAVLQKPLPIKQQNQQLGWAITFINEEHQQLLPSFARMLARKSLVQVTPLPAQLKRYL